MSTHTNHFPNKYLDVSDYFGGNSSFVSNSYLGMDSLQKNEVYIFPTALWDSLWHSSHSKWTPTNPLEFSYPSKQSQYWYPLVIVVGNVIESKTCECFMLSSSALLEVIEQHRFMELFRADWLLFPVDWELHLGPHSSVSNRNWELFLCFLKTV